jgi:uncharacterized protein (TIGR02145 family)
MKKNVLSILLIIFSISCISQGIDTLIDVRDGQKYKIVKIGDQIWMAENLRYIPHVSPYMEQGGIWVYGYKGKNVEEAKNTENYKKYGCLYDWKTATNTENNICPAGWHLPSRDEIIMLMINTGLEKSKAKVSKIKEIIAPKEVGINLMPGGNSGFNYSFGGVRVSNANFSHFEKLGWYWTSTHANPNNAWLLSINKKVKEAAITYWNKICGLSVRCVKDQ